MASVSLDDLLFNRTEEPYTLGTLYKYLDSKLAPELLDFWLAAQDVRNMYEPNHPRSSFSMNRNHTKDDAPTATSSSTMRRQRMESFDEVRPKHKSIIRGKLDNILIMAQELKRRHSEAQMLVRLTYIDDDAPLCINVSDAMRMKVLENCPKQETDDPCLGLFDLAMEECESLITVNYLYPFLAHCAGMRAGSSRDSDLGMAPKPPPLVAKPPPPKTTTAATPASEGPVFLPRPPPGPPPAKRDIS